MCSFNITLEKVLLCAAGSSHRCVIENYFFMSKSSEINVVNIYLERCFLRQFRGLFSQWLSPGFVFPRDFESLSKVLISPHHSLSYLFHLLTLAVFFSECVLNVVWCSDCVLFCAVPNKIRPVFIPGLLSTTVIQIIMNCSVDVVICNWQVRERM